MAITYKSQGAGAATETSGAALSPACPAVVDAGDVLIAHVYWEGTTTAPSTPANWTLLHGPEVIQSTIGRHWIFGKIADGTEDGAAVAFGSPAVTTQRGARVYSFAGRTGGTITELVTGFAATSHATDPQMPTVTTTIAGSLAVACVAQNDNNTAASATGETGGDWVEAVAEFAANLAPGLMMQIQTATPTGDPGTISGGSVATANDPCGVIGFQIKPNANQTVTPGVGALTTTTFAPSVTVSDNQVVTPGVVALTLTTFAPTVTVEAPNVTVTPGTAALTTSGFAPTVSISDHQVVTPAAAALALTGFAPSVLTPVTVTPGVVALTLGTFAPFVGIGVNVTPDVAALTLTGYAPSVSIDAAAAYGCGGAELRKPRGKRGYGKRR